MKNPFPILLAVVLMACSLSPTGNAAESALRISNILGKHILSQEVSIEIYANTKGELWYNVIIDGKDRGGSTLPAKTGQPASFYWDREARALWVIAPEQVNKADYSKENSASSSGANLDAVQAMNPPKPVLDLVEEIRQSKK